MVPPTMKRQRAMDVPTIPLSSGVLMPLLGFGTWGGKDDARMVAAAVRTAITENGFRSIDCAECYKNEAAIGEVLEDVIASAVVSRDELFITSKVWNTNHAAEHVRAACKRSLANLRVKKLDLYLVHWPFAWQHIGPDLEWGPDKARMPMDASGDALMAEIPLQETWRAMEALVDDGLVTHIGVSNFNAQTLNDLLTYARIRPAVNQVEMHPYLSQSGLRTFCAKNGIAITAFSPLGRPGQHGGGPLLVEDAAVLELSQRLSITPSQVLLRWALQKGHAAIPKSSNSARQAENMAAAALDDLTPEDMAVIDSLDRGHRFCAYPTWCRGTSCFS